MLQQNNLITESQLQAFGFAGPRPPLRKVSVGATVWKPSPFLQRFTGAPHICLQRQFPPSRSRTWLRTVHAVFLLLLLWNEDKSSAQFFRGRLADAPWNVTWLLSRSVSAPFVRPSTLTETTLPSMSANSILYTVSALKRRLRKINLVLSHVGK